ncbi:MAG TPA: DUF1428 domain-containing protein [Vicinamibacterales bacterium]|jgi:uncharacterized protein YbaA (DUF1428 family)
MPYVDGFLLAVPKRKIAVYRQISRRAGKIWREHGALEYRECAGDDLNTKMGRPFAKAAGLKSGETVVFSWIVYRSRAERNRVNRKVMQDPRMLKMMNAPMPFDVKRMSMAGFKVIVDLT